MSQTRTYKPEDVSFYQEQERLCKYVGLAIQAYGYSTDLYTPVGGWRPILDKERAEEPWPNQLLAAYRIFFFMFCFPHPIVLIYCAALFQGGKSGVIQALTRLMLTNANKLQNRYGIAILTAMNDIAWMDQTARRIVTELKDQIYHLGTMKKFLNEIEVNAEANGGQAKNIFMIDDESRIGSKNRHLKGDILSKIKQTSPFDTWREQNIRYLYVDATDPAVAINMAKLRPQGLGMIIKLALPPSYLSIQKLRQEGRFHQSHNLLILTEVQALYNEIKTIYGLEPLWHLIRLPNTRSGLYARAKKLLTEVFGQEFQILEWNSTKKEILTYEEDDDDSVSLDTEEINDQLKQPPIGEKPCLILLKNMFYAGKTLVDTYVGAMHDRSSEQDDVTGQSFAGRASGHNRSNRTHVWTNLSGIDRLINEWTDIISMDDDQTVLEPPRATPALNDRMPHVVARRPIGSNEYTLQTTGEEISRPENLRNQEVTNIPTRLRACHMLESGPHTSKEEAMRVVSQYYGRNFTARMVAKDGYYLNSRLLSWYKRQYADLAVAIAAATGRGQSAAALQPRHRLTMEQYNSITKTFGCSSRSGQPYLLYPVYENNTNSTAASVTWYIRYIRREFTRYRVQPTT